jgi:acetyl-CoA synthetase
MGSTSGYNCVDYKQSRYRNKAAYIQEAPELGISRSISYADLYDVVVKYSAALRNSGVGKGDRVLFYIPNCIEAAAMLQACARIGAISTCVFAGFSPGALADRIELTKPKVIFTQDFTVRRGKKIGLKESVNESLALCSRKTIEALKLIIINPAGGKEGHLNSGREILLAEFEEKYKDGNGESVFLEANEPLLIMCTSGTTAKLKSVVHVHGGFQIWTYWTAKWVYNIKPDDVIFNTSDIGWIVGQSYMVFAPLLAGSSVILYEGTPDFPRPDMWWDIMEKHQATMFWTSPTGARVLRGLGIEQVEKHNLTSLERVVVAGEVLNPQVWAWLHDDVFKKKISVFDHMWQTEVPGSMFGYSYGVQMPQVRPGSAGFPLPGVIPEIVDDRTGEQCSPNEKGVLLLREPVPGMTPLYGKTRSGTARNTGMRNLIVKEDILPVIALMLITVDISGFAEGLTRLLKLQVIE